MPPAAPNWNESTICFIALDETTLLMGELIAQVPQVAGLPGTRFSLSKVRSAFPSMLLERPP